MKQRIINLVRENIDSRELNRLLDNLRALDNELDLKMEDIRTVQQSISVIDRINIFTNTDDELRLKEENKLLQQIRDAHGQVIENIKGLIREAIYRDFSVALKIQTGEIIRAMSSLKVEHKWGVNTANHHYQIGGLKKLKDHVSSLAGMIDAQYQFTDEYFDTEELLNFVYEDVLRREGFISE